ncbi:MAG: polyprenyl synthetase family protein [Fervidicoccaceae archaeon]
MREDLWKEIENFFAREKPILDNYLDSLLERDVDAEAIEVSRYITEGGKRLRGLLMLYFLKLLKGDYTYGLPAAASLELVHSCSLAIDDIIDADVTRRGKPSAWVAKGLSKTVLVSNLLIPIAIRSVEYLGFDAVKLVVNTWLNVTRGEISDALSSKRSYLEVVSLKTSSLFQLSLQLSALASDRRDLMNTFEEYGMILGYIYQISDDLLDIKSYLENDTELPPFGMQMLSWFGVKRNELIWDDLVGMVKPLLKQLYYKAKVLSQSLKEKKIAEVMEELPRFIANKILEEGGMSWEAIIS